MSSRPTTRPTSANDEADLIRSEFAALVALDPPAAMALIGELKELHGSLRAVA